MMPRILSALCLASLLCLPGCGPGDRAKAPTRPSAPKQQAATTNRTKSTTPKSTAPETGEKNQPATDPNAAIMQSVADPRLRSAYQQCVKGLEEDPGNPMLMMRKVSVLYVAAMSFLRKNDRDHALPAMSAALKEARLVLHDVPNPPDNFKEVLSQVFYNGACCEALAGNAEQAQKTLSKAVELGWSDIDAIGTDPDLASVRALPRFDKLFGKWMEMARRLMLERGKQQLAAGETFPFDFDVTAIDGQKIRLADLKGKVVIVDIWGTWCPPCRGEIPSFVKLQTKYGPKGLQIIGLNYEHSQGDSALKGVKDFVKAHGINYPCAMGTPKIRSQVPDFQGYPTTLFIDRTGNVRLKVVGAHPYGFLEAVVHVLLDEKAPAAKKL